MAGSLFGLGGGCFRGDGRPLPSSRLNTECREGGLEDGPARDWARPSTAAGAGAELQWRRLGPLLSSALGERMNTESPSGGAQGITQMVAPNRLKHTSSRLLGKSALPARLEDAGGAPIPRASRGSHSILPGPLPDR